MSEWLRRIRAAAGLGLTWAFAWFAAGVVLLLVVGPDAADVPFPLFFGLLGFLSGGLFSGVLRLAEGRRRFDELSLPRFAAWGGLGAVLLAVTFVAITDVPADVLTVLVPVFALAGAGSAAGTLALARMSEDRELLDVSTSVDEVGLSEDEARELLGRGG